MNLGTNIKPHISRYIYQGLDICLAKCKETRSNWKMVYATLCKFSHGDGSLKGQREEGGLQCYRLTSKALPGLASQRTPLAQKDFNKPFSCREPTALLTSPGTVLASTSNHSVRPLEITLPWVREDLKLQLPKAALNNLSENQLMECFSGHPVKP